MGDFWGIEVTDPEMLDQKGVSALIINSKKGERFIKEKEVLEKTKSKEKDIKELIKYNPALVESVKMPLDRQRVLNDLRYNNIRITSGYYYMKHDCEELLLEKENLLAENKRLATELNTIINSKRWKMMDKGINKINKILRRK